MASAESMALEVFHRAAERMPAYQAILADAKISAAAIRTIDDFRRLPVLDKRGTFGRFEIGQLCLDGHTGPIASVLTSSGHSGQFAYSWSDRETADAAASDIDATLEQLFDVRSKATLLINCLPMGVKVPTRICTLAETSVRPDMVVALVKTFGPQYDQVVLLGDAAFIKLVLELGEQSGVDWRRHRVHVVLGEELLAENARECLHSLLGSKLGSVETGVVFSSMGMAELGINLFFEVPPIAPLIQLRNKLHHDQSLRRQVLGDCTWMPSLFTYDQRRVFVEVIGDSLVLTSLSSSQRIPLVRYATGDRAQLLILPASIWPELAAAGVDFKVLDQIPIVAIWGRGQHALAGDKPIYPEAVKEGLYQHADLARQVTANFRLSSGASRAQLRIQLAPQVEPHLRLEQQLAESIERYTAGPIRVICEPYAAFTSGMQLDYERKFDYLGE